MNDNGRAVWDASDCALLLVDYQDSVLAQVFEQDRRLIEFNASSLAKLALRFDIPVVLSTIGVEIGGARTDDSGARFRTPRCRADRSAHTERVGVSRVRGGGEGNRP